MNAPDEDQDQRTIAALADAARLTGRPCYACGTAVCGHEAVFALVLGYKNAPRCLDCTAAHMREDAGDLRERTLTYVEHHDCFLAAWRRAGELEASRDALRPACVWRAVAGHRTVPAAIASAAVAPTTVATTPAAAWDAGDMGCGDLVLELRTRLSTLPPGAVLELRAEDPGAPLDLPSWCNLTGHTLVAAAHPIYRIRRKA